MLSLDLRTVSLIMGIASVLQAVVIVLYYLVGPRYRGIGLWACASIVNAVGFVLLVVRDVAPDVVSIFVANTALVAGMVLLHRGLNRFVEQRRPAQERLLLVLAVITASAFAPLAYPFLDITRRTIIISILTVIVYLLCGWNVARAASPDLRQSYWFTAAVFISYSSWTVVRALLAARSPSLPGLFEPTTLQVVAFLVLLVTVMLSTAGLVAMATQRLLCDLQLTREAEQTLLKEVNREVREREQLFRLTFEQSPIGAALVDLDHRFRRVNQPLCAITGYSDQELLARDFLAITHPDDHETDLARVEALTAGVISSYTLEKRYIRKDGRTVWVQVSARLMKDVDGQPLHLLGLIEDISERKAVEQRLRVIEHQQQLVLRTIPDQFWLKDVDGRYILASDALTRFHGKGPEAFIGRTADDIYAPELATIIRTGDELVFRTGEIYHSERQIHSHTGQATWVHTTRAPVYDDEGMLIGIVGLARDISERKLAEQELRRSRTQLEQALWGAGLGLWDWHIPSGTMEANEQLAELIGMSLADITPIVESWKRHTHPHDLPYVNEMFASALTGQSAGVEVEYRIRHRDGTWRWQLCRGRVVEYSDDGTALRLIGVTQDISARKQVEQMLRVRIDELLALNQIAQALTTWTDITAGLESVGMVLCSLFNASEAVVWTYHSQEEALQRLIAVNGVNIHTHKERVALAQTAAGRRIYDEPSAFSLLLAPDDGLRSATGDKGGTESQQRVLIAPLRARNTLIGLLCMQAAQVEQVYTPTDIALAQTIAGVLGSALENARLFAEAQSRAAERERRRLAHELHDSVSQALFAANRTAEVLPQIWELDPNEGREALHDLQRLTSSALAEMRALLVELRPRALVETPLHETLGYLAPVVAAKSAIRVDTNFQAVPLLPPDVQVGLYRITQEALNNVTKHAQAQHVALQLNTSSAYMPHQPWSGTLTITICDDGRGFDTSCPRVGRMGLLSMRERAAEVGATIAITSAPSQGTHVTVQWCGNAAVLERMAE